MIGVVGEARATVAEALRYVRHNVPVEICIGGETSDFFLAGNIPEAFRELPAGPVEPMAMKSQVADEVMSYLKIVVSGE